MDDGEDGYLELDPEECALGAILKALVNYLQIDGHQPDLFNAFKLWMTQNLDHNKYNVHCDPDWKIN